MNNVVGLHTYGAYELTNLATLKSWPLAITVVVLVWGTVLTTLAAGAGYLPCDGCARQT